jgi:hypothetical protein
MSRVYEEAHGERRLLLLTCDKANCTAEVRPAPDIAESGWTKVGGRDPDGCKWESHYCPEHGE